MRNIQPISVDLGDLEASVERRVESGAYASASDVIRAGLQALDREDAALEAIMKARIIESIEDPRPDIPADEVFAALRARHAARSTGGTR